MTEKERKLVCCYELDPGQYEIQRGHNPIIVEEINKLLFGEELEEIKEEMAKYWLETRKKLANLIVNRVFWEPNGEDVTFAEYLTGYPDLKQVASNLKVLVERNPEDVRYQVLLDLVNQGAKPTCLHESSFVDLRDYIVNQTIQIYQLEQNLEYLELSEEKKEQKKTKLRNAFDALKRPPTTTREAALSARLPELINELEYLEHISEEERKMMYEDSHIRRRSLNAAIQQYKESYVSHLGYITEEIDRYLLEGETGVLIGKVALDDRLQARLEELGTEIVAYPLPEILREMEQQEWTGAIGKGKPIFVPDHPSLCPICKVQGKELLLSGIRKFREEITNWKGEIASLEDDLFWFESLADWDHILERELSVEQLEELDKLRNEIGFPSGKDEDYLEENIEQVKSKFIAILDKMEEYLTRK